MIDRTARRGRLDSHGRLAGLIRQAHADPPAEVSGLPADQPWEDVSATEESAPGRDRVPPWWRRGRPGRLVERWVPGGASAVTAPRRRVTVVVGGGVALGLAVAAGVALSSPDARPQPPPGVAMSTVSSAPSSAAAADSESIVVSVVGKVAKPGLVTLPADARVADALRKCGGAAPGVDLAELNLARRLADGEQIYVGVARPPNAEPDPAAGPATGGGATPAPVDLNTASSTALETLPGVGPVTAQRIIDWRTEHGGFTAVEQLREVDGIGPARFDDVRDLVTVR